MRRGLRGRGWRRRILAKGRARGSGRRREVYLRLRGEGRGDSGERRFLPIVRPVRVGRFLVVAPGMAITAEALSGTGSGSGAICDSRKPGGISSLIGLVRQRHGEDLVAGEGLVFRILALGT